MSKEVKLQISPVSKGKAKSPKASKSSKSPYDNPICSACQASGRMIAVHAVKLAPGITLAIEYEGMKHLSAIRDVDPEKLEPISAFMHFFPVPTEILKQIDNETETI